MTAAKMRMLLADLDMSAWGFAAVVGVSVATVYRWCAKGTANCDPLQAEIIERCGNLSKARRRAAGQVARLTLASDGNLRALQFFLREILRKER